MLAVAAGQDLTAPTAKSDMQQRRNSAASPANSAWPQMKKTLGADVYRMKTTTNAARLAAFSSLVGSRLPRGFVPRLSIVCASNQSRPSLSPRDMSRSASAHVAVFPVFLNVDAALRRRELKPSPIR